MFHDNDTHRRVKQRSRIIVSSAGMFQMKMTKRKAAKTDIKIEVVVRSTTLRLFIVLKNGRKKVALWIHNLR